MDFIEQLQRETPENRESILKSHAYRVKEGAYTRPLTKDELVSLKEEYVQTQIRLNAKKDELKNIQDEFKAEIKPLEKISSHMLNDLNTKTRSEAGMTYEIDDQENRVMLILDKYGNLITQRPLMAEERNLHILSSSKNLSNG